MPWRESSVVEERLRFVVVAGRKEQSFRELCAEFGVSRQTGYLWLRRYFNQGAKGLADQSRRPKTSPKRTPEDIEQRVVELRQKWPDWGAPKLAKVLGEQSPPVKLPMRTVHRILQRRGLIQPEDRNQQASQRFERCQPNELWQMDFKGPQGFNKGSPVGPLSVLDDHSRYLLVLRHLGNTQMAGVRETLTGAFLEYGLPERMLIDHGTPWWNAQSPWGLTELSVWIMRLGVRLTYSGVCHPQTQGKVERMHGALQRAVRKRKANPEDQVWLDGFRHEYNYVRPHAALGFATPSSRWRPSPRPLPAVLRAWDYEAGMEAVQLGCDGQLSWRGRRWEISNALRRMVVGIQVLDTRAIVYFCRTPMRELDLETGTTLWIVGKPIRSWDSAL